ncbi:MAG: DNA internalization-related competence protein ComEC/Rec2, partial [Acinetobacter sp.]|nr:DNA internalization-related competence protein ComEC/Rec2 [Acinetobacter sp.]
MLKIILLGWIAGIAVMGHHFTVVGMTWWIWLAVAVAIFSFGLYKKEYYFYHPFYKALILISASWGLFATGYHFADSALEQRLQLKEFEAQSFEAIIYIKNIDELTEDGHK